MLIYNANKLKVQLRLAVNRLKMMQNKKASINAQQRREIASLLEKGKVESAKIRVEHIIREDYNIEAMEMIEIYCEMLLARFGLIEQMKTMDDSISEPIASIIYASPRSEVKELLTIKEYLTLKYGKEFALKSADNKNNMVNERLIQKLKVKVPDPKLVNRYLIEIARNYNVAWSGEDDLDIDSSLMGDSSLEAEFSLPAPPPSNQNQRPPKGGGSSGSGGQESSFGGSAPASSMSDAGLSTANPSLLDDLFPSVPKAASPTQTPEEEEENVNVDDDNMPDFDELTKRFEALKKRQ